MTATTDAKRDAVGGGFRLKGWHVLAMLIAFFGVIFAVNFTMASLAIGSFPGEVASSYTASQRYNGEIAAAASQAGRGWSVDEHIARGADGRATVTVTARDRAGAPVEGLAVTARLEHPVKSGADLAGALAPTGPGAYAGVIDGVEVGAWTLVVEGRRGAERLWRSDNRVVLR